MAPPSGERTPSSPSATPPAKLARSGMLGRLLNGLPAVRMTKMTSVCVASDSMNQPLQRANDAVLLAWRLGPVLATGELESLWTRLARIAISR
jgi:hypothetical protein